MTGRTHLIGILTDLKTNEDLSAIFLQLEQPVDLPDESLEDGPDNFPKGPIHSVRLAGDWVEFIREDLELAWEVHLDLHRFDPIWNKFEHRWEFDSGIQADLLLQDTKESKGLWYMKRIELSECPPSFAS